MLSILDRDAAITLTSKTIKFAFFANSVTLIYGGEKPHVEDILMF